MRPGYFLFKVLFISFVLSGSNRVQAQQVTHTYKEMETELLQLVNDYRTSIKLKPLKVNVFVSNLAERHSRDMATKKVDCGNEGFKQRTDKIYEQQKPVYSFAENIACGKLTAREVMDDWLNSEKHKKNMEGDFNYSGIGIAKNADSFYVTEIFILK
jgi:uncharacterized protein YkwD